MAGAFPSPIESLTGFTTAGKSVADDFDVSNQPRVEPIEINPISALTGVTNFDTTPNLGPINTSLPSSIKSYNDKYSPSNQVTRNLPTPILNALQQYDQARIARGSSPLSENQTRAVSTAAQTKQAVAPEPQGNIFSHALSDLGAIVQSVPHLPQALWHEAAELPNTGTAIAQTGGDVSKILQAPGIRLIPGTYTASNILGGHADQLAEHPLFTALDVLPYASKATKALPVYEVAKAEEAARAAQLSKDLGFGVAEQRVNPVTTALTKRVAGEAETALNPLGRGIEAAKGAFATTRPGELINDAFGQTARQGMQAFNANNQWLADAVQGKIPDNEISQWTGEANSINTRHPGIEPARREELVRAMQNPVDDAGKPVESRLYTPDDRPAIDIPQLTTVPKELGFLYEVKDLVERSRVRKVANDELATVPGIADEVFTKQQAAKITKLQNWAGTYEARFNRKGQVTEALNSALDAENPTTIQAGRGEARQGVDTSLLHDTVSALEPYSRTDPGAAVFLKSYKRGDYGTAAGQLRQLGKSARFAEELPNHSSAADIINELDKLNREQGRLRYVTEEGLARRQQRVDRVVAAQTPARFGPAMDQQFQSTLKDLVTNGQVNVNGRNFTLPDFLTDPKADAYLRAIDEGNYSSFIHNSPMEVRDFYNLRREVNSTWQDMKAQGLDPVYMHRVAPESAASINNPSITNKLSSPSSIRARTLDISPYTQDAQVAMTHEGMEYLQRQATKAYFKSIAKAYGKPEGELRESYLTRARQAQQYNPQFDVSTFVDKYMRKDGWTPLEPDEVAPWMKAKSGTVSTTNRTWVPAELKRNMERIFDPHMGKLASTLDPAMRVFRTSILPLSPRWHVYNILGGAMMLMGETDPTVFRFARQAYDMAKTGALHEIPGAPPKGFFGLPEDAVNWGKNLSEASKVAGMQQYSAGRWLRDLWDGAASTRARGGFNSLVQKSYSFNGFFDDFYRSMAYLQGEGKAIRQGAIVGSEEAQRAGIGLVRKIMQNWDEITPIERTVLRSVFPFYGWMKTILQYVYHYPFDHPVRSSVLGSFARNELNDMGTGLPQDLLNLIQIGDIDENGNVLTLNTRGMNPFADVHNYFTLSGFLGQSNPVIGAIAKTLGIDMQSGGASLYPDTTYNPETGKLESQNGNLLTNLATGIFPPGEAINKLVFDKQGFNDLLKSNPAAAGRMLQSTLGIPVIAQSRNMPQEYIKSEVARQSALNDAFNEAKKTGDYQSFLAAYPSMRGYIDALSQLQSSGKLDKFQLGGQQGTSQSGTLGVNPNPATPGQADYRILPSAAPVPNPISAAIAAVYTGNPTNMAIPGLRQ